MGVGEGEEGVQDDWWVSGFLSRWWRHVEQEERGQEHDEFKLRPKVFGTRGHNGEKQLQAPGYLHLKVGKMTEPET